MNGAIAVRAVMQTDLVTVHPDTPLREAVELLVLHRISGLPVVDDDSRIVGVLSEKDLLKAFYEPVKRVGELMTPDPDTVPSDAPLVDVFDMLMANNFRRVLVHERGKLVGLVSRADLMPVVLDVLLERSHQPPHPPTNDISTRGAGAASRAPSSQRRSE